MRIPTYHDLVSLFAYATPIWASLSAGALVVVTLSLSMYLLFDHLSAYKNPEVFVNLLLLFVELLFRFS